MVPYQPLITKAIANLICLEAKASGNPILIPISMISCNLTSLVAKVPNGCSSTRNP